ncbi:PAS domain-containing protein [Devosia sp. PTR5]|uniref:Blue-light-activated histidine kinase n=1 Tax=Devosia oryzisoli TaxID=2774138 RepID=A0A927FS06_9HYPH|nr:HWE histidine kinase domain-containing protein [Devosia oryzisoli]MBD8065180.1 PAS domain-containing protein [Devosia oryzisoli]
MNDDDLAIAVAETTPAMLWMGDENGRCLFLNEALRKFWGVDPENLDAFVWSSTLHPDDIETLQAPFVQAMRDHTPFSVEARYRRADGAFRIMRTQANPRFDKAGRFLGMAGVNIDVTDQRAAEEQSRYLLGEINHRTKNLLAVVQAIARNTARSSLPETFLDTFAARLSGLAASNDLLVAQDWSSVHLADLVIGQLRTIGADEDLRVTIDGPPILVSPRHAQVIGMAMHELATNSLKHGALAHPEGQLRIAWSGASDANWVLEWDENLPSTLTLPERKGFGHVVMVDMVKRAIEGQVNFEFRPSGVLWRLTVEATDPATATTAES